MYIEELAEEAELWDGVGIGIQEEDRGGLLRGCASFNIQNDSNIQNDRIELYKDLMYKRFDNKNTLQFFYDEEHK